MTYRIKEDSASPPTSGPESGAVSGNDASRKGAKPKPAARLTSLDAFRGFIMIALAASGFGISRLAASPDESPLWNVVDRSVLERIAFHVEHPPWQSSVVPGTYQPGVGSPWLHVGVSFWDLIQPAFMFMVGAAMPFSYARREALGESRWKRSFHALLRAVVLVLLGVFLASLRTESTHWLFTNVLAQIGLGYFFAYLLLGRAAWIQWTALAVILVGTWIGIHVYPVADDDPAAVKASYERGEVYKPPYRQWSKNGNAFHDFDVWFLNLFPRPKGEAFEFSPGGYQTLNFVPSIATMLLGILCGQLLLSPALPRRKLMYLVIGALICWGLGILAGASCCPIVKRIWTPGWVLFSGGFVIGMLALFYLLFDILPLKRLAFPLVVVGMNSIAVYLMGQTLKRWFVDNLVQTHFGGAVEGVLGLIATRAQLLERLDVSAAEAGPAMYAAFQPVVDSVSVLLVIWLIAYWLYRQRIFIRI